MEVKCIVCQERFGGKDALINHLISQHNVPRNDKTLNSYATLRFSSASKRSTKLKELLSLLKLLKTKAIRYSLEREKVLLGKKDVVDLFANYLKSDSAAGQLERLSYVRWFLTFYNVYINENHDEYKLTGGGDDDMDLAKCFCVKFEEKNDISDNDFNFKMMTRVHTNILWV